VPFLDALEKITGQLAKVVEDPAAAGTLAGASLLCGPGVAGAIIPVILILRFKAQWDKERIGSAKSADLMKALEDQLRAVHTMEKGNLKDIDRLIAAEIPDAALPLLILFRDIRKNKWKLDGLGSSLAEASASLKTIRTTVGTTDVRIGNLESNLLQKFSMSHEALVKNLRIETSNLPKSLRPCFNQLEKSLAIPLDEILNLTRDLVEHFNLHEGAKHFRESVLLDYARQIDREFDEPEILSVRRAVKSERISLSRLFVEPMLRQLVRPDPSALEMPSEEFFALQRELKRGRPEEFAERYKLASASYLVHEPTPARPVIDDWEKGGILLFGGAGGGKSALLRIVALRWARVYRDESTRAKAGPVPIVVELRRYATARVKSYNLTLLKYIADANDSLTHLPEKAVRAALAEGRARLFLDGLDEIPAGDSRRKILGEIHRFLDLGYPCLVTSRVFGFEPAKWCARSDTVGYHMLTLDQDQQKLFIRGAAEQMERGEEGIARILERVERRLETLPHAEEMAANPLLLTLILLVHSTGAGVETRADLYEQASEMLIDAWEEKRMNDFRPPLRPGVEALQKKTKIRILHHLAWQRLTHPTKDGENLFSLADVARAINVGGRNLSEQTKNHHEEHFPDELRERHYVLCSRGGNKVSFVHRTFLEYFAAIHLAWLAETEKLNADSIYREYIRPHLHDERWQQTLRLYLSLAAEPDLPELHRLLLSEPLEGWNCSPLLLSAEAFLETRQEARSYEIARNIAQSAAAYLSSEDFANLDWQFHRVAGTQPRQLLSTLVRLDLFLGRPFDRWRDPSFGRGVYGGPFACVISELARELGPDKPLRGFLEPLVTDRGESHFIRVAAIKVLDRVFGATRDMSDHLQDIASEENEVQYVRYIALLTLGALHESDPKIRSFLENLSANPNYFIRHTVSLVFQK
jgi:hypothetical protein